MTLETASIIIPTYKRPKDILRALRSVIAQNVTGFHTEIIVADNDPLASAKDAVNEFIRQNSAIKIIYTHIPQPGVSNARNGALDLATGRFIIFLDDDMEAQPGWVQALLDTSLKFNAQMCFGPIEAVMPKIDNPLHPFIQPLFSRGYQTHSGIITETFGTGGCLIDRKTIQLPSPVFDPRLNETGGEDNALFNYLLTQDAKVAWAADAKTFEHVPAHRTTKSYIWKRQFAFGQGPSQHAADAGAIATLGVLKWMLVGCVQSVIRFPQYIALNALNRPSAITAYANFAQAVGKILWWGDFKPKLYGMHAPKASK